MAAKSSVLQALKILGLEEMLKLSEVLQVMQVPLKQAAGGEHIVWDEEASRAPQKPAKILTFPKKTSVRQNHDQVDLEDHLQAQGVPQEVSTRLLVETDMLLWQRELARSTDEIFYKQEAFKGYKKATEIYSVKTSDLEGKEKIRFANTKGVLINKKQA